MIRRMTNRFRGRFFLAWLAVVPALRGGAVGASGDSCPSHLFVLARSKNANIVAYDLGGRPSEPVVAYWLLDGEEGRREELNLVERQRAYGVDVMKGDAPQTSVMTFRASRRRRFILRTVNGCPAATASIGGHDGILRRIFVQSKEGGLQPRVEYVELFGEDLATGEALYEKFVPEE